MKPRQRGATLTQVIVTMGIASSLFLVGAHELMQWLPAYRLSAAARTLVIHIQRAKIQAIQRRSSSYLDFNPGPSQSCRRALLWEDRNDNHRRDQREPARIAWDLAAHPGIEFGPFPQEFGGPARGPNKTSVTAGGSDGITFAGNRIKFNPDGTCSTGTIYLHNQRGETYAIRLRYNGLTQLWLHHGGAWHR